MPFLLVVILLAVAAILAGPVAKWMNIELAKKAIQLVRPLSTLTAADLAPYRVVNRAELAPAMVDALGTSQYINWLLEDTSKAPEHTLRFVSLFVTYYSGGRDKVPHTPDECYLGSGYQPTQPHENRNIEVAGIDGDGATVPIRLCTFGKTAVFQRAERTVVYTFHCNGRFVATRTGVRLLINDLSETYAYFSKVEVSFPRATRVQSVEGAAVLFGSVLPKLIENHWPDFDAAERAAKLDTRD